MIPAGGFCPNQIRAKIAATGTSKKTIKDTTAGETLFRVRLNIV
jgi:hypothetical protein